MQKGKLCPLCERHRKMHTTDNMDFWTEWGEDGKPRLCMDSTTTGAPPCRCFLYSSATAKATAV